MTEDLRFLIVPFHSDFRELSLSLYSSMPTSSRCSASTSWRNAGFRCIICSRIPCGVCSDIRKSAMSRPCVRCSSVAICSSDSNRVAFIPESSNSASFLRQSSVALRSGTSITSLPLSAWIASLLRQLHFCRKYMNREVAASTLCVIHQRTDY